MRPDQKRAYKISRAWYRLLREGHPYADATYVLAVETVDRAAEKRAER